MYRHKSYDAELAHELKDMKFAREFLSSLMEGEEGLSSIDALRHTIRRMGTKEFAEKAKIPYESVCRMLESETLPKIDTLDRYFAPFKLKTKIVLEEVA